MRLKMTLYHKLAVAQIVFTDETKTEAQSTKLTVTPDKTVSFGLNIFISEPILSKQASKYKQVIG